ncbi:MAG: type II secretion system protein [Candidatus Pacebacteria bacterium]|nr:type II secretion system protein [Candidatus Paceibacterota bacterium]
MKKNFSQGSKLGFTLIELLVVVAIIGILASVILASLNNARSKGNDATVKSDLATVQTQAQLYYDDYSGAYRSTVGSGDYEGNCLTSSSVFQDTTGASSDGQAQSKIIAAAINNAFKSGGGAKDCRLSNLGDKYMVAIKLASVNAYWCVDSQGNAIQISSLPSSGPPIYVGCQ